MKTSTALLLVAAGLGLFLVYRMKGGKIPGLTTGAPSTTSNTPGTSANAQIAAAGAAAAGQVIAAAGTAIANAINDPTYRPPISSPPYVPDYDGEGF